MLGAGVILRKKHFLSADNVCDDDTARNSRGGFNAVGKARGYPLFYDKSVNDYLNVVLLVFFELYLLRS